MTKLDLKNGQKKCIRKACQAKDKEGNFVLPTTIRVSIVKAYNQQYRDAESLNCPGCGESWIQLTTIRTREEFKAWKEKEAETIKKVIGKISEQRRSEAAAQAGAKSLINNEI